MSPRTVIPTKVSNGVYTVSNLDSQLLIRSSHYCSDGKCRSNHSWSIQIFIQIGSSGSVNYRHTGSDHIMGFHYENGILSISCGSTSHQVNKEYNIYRGEIKMAIIQIKRRTSVVQATLGSTGSN